MANLTSLSNLETPFFSPHPNHLYKLGTKASPLHNHLHNNYDY